MPIFLHYDDFYKNSVKSLTNTPKYGKLLKLKICMKYTSLPHNFDYVVFLFIAVIVPIFVFDDDVRLLFPLCISALYLCLSVRVYRRGVLYPFEWNNKCAQTNAGDYEETLFPCQLLRFRKAPSSFSILCFYQVVFLFS